MASYVLGISAFYHDSAAALIKDGEVIFAAHEERFSRIKHDSSFPSQAIQFCLKEANIKASELESVVFYDKPLLKFERIIKNFLSTWPMSYKQFIMAIPVWLKEKIYLKKRIIEELNITGDKIKFSTHHLSHAASAVYTSPFQESAFLTIDGVGEFASLSYGIANKEGLNIIKEIHFPNSLGLLYSTITGFLGFKVNSAEYKVMGLAPYGKDTYAKEVKQLVNLNADGSFALNMQYFNFHKGDLMYSKKLSKLLRRAPRKSESELTQSDFDLAHSIQKLTENIVLKLAKKIADETKMQNLCLAGGVALNCVANGKLVKEKIFNNVYIQPAAGDAGGAIGAAMYYYYKDKEYLANKFFSPYLGPSYDNHDIIEFLDNENIKYQRVDSDLTCTKEVAKLLADNQVVAWMQDRAEFGPRALGNRSILADPRIQENWQRVNLKVKFREDFRPFAPACLLEKASNYFDIDIESPYMLLTAQVLSKDIPAVTHVDNSARIQTVSKTQNKKFYDLLCEFEKLTECPVLINTSFNVRSEPMVLDYHDAFNTFINTDIDYLVINNFIISKKDNLHLLNEERKRAHLSQFELD